MTKKTTTKLQNYKTTKLQNYKTTKKHYKKHYKKKTITKKNSSTGISGISRIGGGV